jgi:hypothetical protein
MFYLQTLHSELGNQLDSLRIVLHHDELPQLVVGLEPSQQTAELVVVAGVTQPLSSHNNN